ncbi:unnamed protein product [Arctogadus glacialis]
MHSWTPMAVVQPASACLSGVLLPESASSNATHHLHYTTRITTPLHHHYTTPPNYTDTHHTPLPHPAHAHYKKPPITSPATTTHHPTHDTTTPTPLQTPATPLQPPPIIHTVYIQDNNNHPAPPYNHPALSPPPRTPPT